MKKRFFAILCLLLTAALLLPTAAAAQTEPVPETEDADVYAVVNLTDGGSVLVDEAPDAALMSESAGYDLYVADEPVLTVASTGVGDRSPVEAAQFYSVDFTFAGTEIEVFLTGLKTENVEEIQQRIIDSFVRGESFEMADLGFIDAEKNFVNDDAMCWAASAADMLVYTGWAAQAGYADEDDLFEAYIEAFENNGGCQINGVAWFFNGAATCDNSGSIFAQIKDYPDSGAFLNDYAFDQLSNERFFTLDEMDTIAALLREDCAVGLAVDIYYNNSPEPGGSHAVTLWGYIVDNAVSADDPARYLNVFITESDLGAIENADRRTAPDQMYVFALTPGNDTYSFYLRETARAEIYNYTYLEPYSEDIPRETDPAASKDKTALPDLTASYIFLSDTAGAEDQMTLFETGSELFFFVSAYNFGDQVYDGDITPLITITAADGTEVFREARTYHVPSLGTFEYFDSDDYSVTITEAGDYTLTFSINADRSVPGYGEEAFYYNNTNAFSFKVRDSYLLGDFDDSGKVDILDATLIQRRLAEYSDPYGDSGAIRGDADGGGLTILDATVIQRFLAEYTTPYPIGGKKLYA